MTEADAIDLLHIACQKAGSLRAWAKANGLSAPYVSDVLRGQRTLGPRILAALGLEVETKIVKVYRKRKN